MRRDLVAIEHQILDAVEAVEIERAKAIRAAREEVQTLLDHHQLYIASLATGRCPATSYLEFHRMACCIRSGGYHRVRLTGGRNLDG